MKISLITVTWQSAETLKETLKSVRAQNCVNLEYIVVDGASTDGTVELLKDNQDIITRWVSEPDTGIYDAMNKGLKMATGDVIGFLHADDVLARPHILKNILQHFKTHSTEILYGDLEYVSNKTPHKVVRYWKSLPFSDSLLRKGWMPPHPTVYLRKEVLSAVGYFDLSYRISADYDWLLRAFSKPGIRCDYLPGVVVKMRLGGASNRSVRNLLAKTREDYSALRKSRVGGVRTLFLKNISKLSQFIVRDNKAAIPMDAQ